MSLYRGVHSCGLVLLFTTLSIAPLHASAVASAAGATAPASETQPPIAKKKVTQKYPFELRKKGVEGAALIEFTVTETGNVIEAKVVRATEPAFGVAALRAVEQWKYEPARQNGKPSSSRQQQSIGFSLAGDDISTTPLLFDRTRFVAALPPKLHVIPEAGSTEAEAFEALKKSLEMLGQTQTSFIKLPTGAKPPRVLHKVPPVYPPVLRDQGVSGGASYLLLVDDQGDVRAICCTMTTAKEFVDAGATSLAKYKFVPAEVSGKPVSTLVTQTVLFETH